MSHLSAGSQQPVHPQCSASVSRARVVSVQAQVQKSNMAEGGADRRKLSPAGPPSRIFKLSTGLPIGMWLLPQGASSSKGVSKQLRRATRTQSGGIDDEVQQETM
eukprot:CAMPEP_0202923278 /NCGR_PEP_ID=MMETSP1392-20130828/78366_1 /ASSEMBLY_ACC=CAM_ASM_000868 /TAXON_ID=225041 /ORGANISM="Chlamydomonas chlamydogama, Strain SAG 11-48b" /LENGTH=104 /DNA_ID=CAMNT_0049616955 /DNA_START=317 /DNA_END=631 /DNA_ORIENTATION=+